MPAFFVVISSLISQLAVCKTLENTQTRMPLKRALYTITHGRQHTFRTYLGKRASIAKADNAGGHLGNSEIGNSRYAAEARARTR